MAETMSEIRAVMQQDRALSEISYFRTPLPCEGFTPRPERSLSFFCVACGHEMEAHAEFKKLEVDPDLAAKFAAEDDLEDC